jgi:transcriptional regulator with XRE-family HTH domain
LQEKNCLVHATFLAIVCAMSSRQVQNRIALLIKAKRREEDLGVRAAAAAAEVSAATISRLERGVATSLPDAETLTKLAKWLGVSVSDLLNELDSVANTNVSVNTIPEVVEVHLRADKNLNPKTAEALAQMFKALYEQATKS